jgi:hypothetical protein
VHDGGDSCYANADGGGGLGQAVLQLERLRLAQSAAKTGVEGRLQGRGAAVRGGEVEGQTGQVGQPCQYASMECAGCHVAFVLGERMVSHGAALVHGARECMAAHDVEAAQTAQAELEAARTPPRYYGVYSDETGASGVYLEWAEVARLVEGEARREAHAVSAVFESYAGAVEFVQERTRARAGEVGVGYADARGGVSAGELRAGGRRLGSGAKAARLQGVLSDSRLGRIMTCIAGECEQAQGDGSETACRGGCGRTLHVESCAQLGRGYAALGNFKCADCRIEEWGDAQAGEGERRTATRIMVLELGQGMETTTAGYAEFVRLEEDYAMGMGKLLDGGFKMPRHSEESFRNFLTWFVLDADRARSLESMVRGAGAFLTKLDGVTDWTKTASVKAHITELLSATGIEQG